jgi:hypothetical protein
MKKTNKNKVLNDSSKIINNDTKRPNQGNMYDIETDENDYSNPNVGTNNTQPALTNTFNKKLSLNINNHNNNINNQK